MEMYLGMLLDHTCCFHVLCCYSGFTEVLVVHVGIF